MNRTEKATVVDLRQLVLENQAGGVLAESRKRIDELFVVHRVSICSLMCRRLQDPRQDPLRADPYSKTLGFGHLASAARLRDLAPFLDTVQTENLVHDRVV